MYLILSTLIYIYIYIKAAYGSLQLFLYAHIALLKIFLGTDVCITTLSHSMNNSLFIDYCFQGPDFCSTEALHPWFERIKM